MASFSDFRSPVVVVILLWIAGLGAAAQFAKFSVSLEHLKELYPAAGAELGLLVSVIGVLGIVFGMLAAVVVAGIGFRSMLLAALVLGAAMSLYQATMPVFSLMLLSRLLEGAAHLSIVVAAPTLIAQLSGERYRGFAMTLWSTFFGVAFALVAWLGIPLINSSGLSALLNAHAAVMMTTALLLAVFLRSDATREAVWGDLSIAALKDAHVAAYRSPSISAPAVGWLFYTLTFVSLLTLLPGLVPRHEQAFVAVSMPLVSIAAALFSGVFLLGRMKAVSVIVLGFALGLTVVVTMIVSSDVSSWACISLFCVLGLVQGASFAAVPELNCKADDRARANGAIAQMGNLGNTLGTPMLLAFLGGFGLHGLLAAVAACYALAIAAHLHLLGRRRTLAKR